MFGTIVGVMNKRERERERERVCGRARSGFTLIELVLVLAIAGLILLTVLITVPALRRSQRDAQRKTDFTLLVAALQQFKARNGGRLPYIRNPYTNGGKKYYIILLRGPNSIADGGLTENGNYNYMASYFEQALVSGVTDEIYLVDNRHGGSEHLIGMGLESGRRDDPNRVYIVMGALCAGEEEVGPGYTRLEFKDTSATGDAAVLRFLESGWYMCKNL